jgi:F-type H+-transporting ATPase subunit b
MNIHLWTFLFQILNFVVVAFVLHWLLYRPLHEAIDRRRQAALDAQTKAEQALRDAESLQARLVVERDDAERQREELVRDAHRQAEAEGQRLLDDARRRARLQCDEVRQQLAHEREEALAAVRQEIVELAVDLAQRFLTQSTDRTLHQQLISRLLASLESVSSDERRQLLIGWTAGDPAVIETAEDLDRESIDRITSAVATLVGQQIELEIKAKPGLISGACLRLGGHVWDASLSGPLDDVRQQEAPEAVHA